MADLVADNRLAELADMDSSALKDLLQELDTGAIDMEGIGFTQGELERLMTQFHVEGIDAPTLRDGDREPFRQCTFTLHDDQFETVEVALRKAKTRVGETVSLNQNSNGNALAFICAAFNAAP